MIVSYRFSAIYFEATRTCNLRCPVCMTGSNNAETVRASRGQELCFEEIRDLVLHPAKRLGVRAIGWSGGEFLLRKDALDLLRLTVDLGFKCNVCSNCELLDRDRLVALKKATRGDLTIAVGLNSLDDDNAWSRNAEADRTLEVLELCRELRIDRHVIITMGRYNTDSFEQTVNYLVKRRISYNRSPLVARGSGCSYFAEQGFSRKDLEEHFHPILRSRVNGYVSYTPFFLSPELHEEVSGGQKNGTVPQNPPIGCWVGNWLALNAEGDVSVCPVLLDELTTGNVRDKPLDELVSQSEMFAALTDRSRLKGRCGHCRYQYTCGGCRAMAYYHTGDYLEEDPTCFFDPVDATTVSEHEEETNRLFKKYLIIARHAGFYQRPQRDKQGAHQKIATPPPNGNGSTRPEVYAPVVDSHGTGTTQFAARAAKSPCDNGGNQPQTRATDGPLGKERSGTEGNVPGDAPHGNRTIRGKAHRVVDGPNENSRTQIEAHATVDGPRQAEDGVR